MKKIICLFIFLTFITTNAQTTITKNIGDYSIVKVYNGIEVELIKSDESKIEISGNKSTKVKTKNVNGTLKISLPFSLNPSDNIADEEVVIKLYYKNNIDIIDANEGSVITANNFNQEKVEVKAQERAFINITTKATYIIVKSSSGGIIKLSGTAKNQIIDLDLYGIYHGFDMKVSETSTVKSGTGAKAEIFAGETLNAKVSFGGSIFYKGTPKIIKDKKVIGGIIQKRD